MRRQPFHTVEKTFPTKRELKVDQHVAVEKDGPVEKTFPTKRELKDRSNVLFCQKENS